MKCRLSLPSWERGLKYICYCIAIKTIPVAPLVGARVEMIFQYFLEKRKRVAPLVGARVEI